MDMPGGGRDNWTDSDRRGGQRGNTDWGYVVRDGATQPKACDPEPGFCGSTCHTFPGFHHLVEWCENVRKLE